MTRPDLGFFFYRHQGERSNTQCNSPVPAAVWRSPPSPAAPPLASALPPSWPAATPSRWPAARTPAARGRGAPSTARRRLELWKNGVVLRSAGKDGGKSDMDTVSDLTAESRRTPRHKQYATLYDMTRAFKNRRFKKMSFQILQIQTTSQALIIKNK